MRVYHELEPIFDSHSKILILGTIPSVKSREMGFYYMHPTNRFWKIMQILFDENNLDTTSEKVTFLKNHKIALWDVLSSCQIDKSADASIKKVKVNNLNKIIKNSQIKYIFTTGNKAFELYQKWCFKKVKIKAIAIPSTSSANCRMSLDELVKAYEIIKKYL